MKSNPIKNQRDDVANSVTTYDMVILSTRRQDDSIDMEMTLS